MDSFTENLLSRARERQKMLENINGDSKENRLSSKRPVLSETNLNAESPKKLVTHTKSNSDGNIPKAGRKNSITQISSDFSTHKTLNIQNDNFNMEIKVSSVDDVRVEVQFEEEDDDKSEFHENGLRSDAKNRLNRLGKLYAGGEDANISSPIHQSESKFCIEKTVKPVETENQKSKRGLSKLADLAQTINQYEDDLSSVRKEKEEKMPKNLTKSRKKSPAPQPPEYKSSPLKPSHKPKAPNPPKIVDEIQKQEKNFAWDKKVLDSLESQGFTRTDSSARLIYKYDNKIEEENKSNKNDFEQTKSQLNSPQKHTPRSPLIADKAAKFETNTNRNQKDPALLSVSERKALFEKNKGTPLIPKAPFAMATPTKITPSKEIERSAKKTAAPPPNLKEVTTPKAPGIANKVAALFETKSTISQQQIEKNIQDQRRQEMDILLNRFHKNEPVAEDSEYDENATEETAMIDEKPIEIVASTSSKEERRSSGHKRCNKNDSPKVAAVLNDVKRIKVSPYKAGRLYPSLTDIESVTETETETETQNEISSSDNSFAESDDANTSFGRDILRVVCKNQNAQKNQQIEESGSDLSDLLDDMDDYIDEALAYSEKHADGPTPPKHGRRSPIESSYSFNYKKYQNENESEFKSPMKKPAIILENKEELPTHVVDGDNLLPLTHTVSFYRKQQSQQSNTPVRQISRQPIVEESPEKEPEEQKLLNEKIKDLKNEIIKQEMIISQTSQALNLCNSTLEFMGSTEQVEADRVLLVATHRRQAALHEKQRLEVERSLRPKRKGYENLIFQKGNLKISKITLPLKQKYVTALAAAGGKGHHVVCLIKYGDQVLPTQLVSTVASNSKNPELELNIPGNIILRDIYSDFTITLEVYCLQAQEEILPHEIKYHIKKSNGKLTPKKSKQDSRLVRPIKESPAGPQVVRSPTFALMGYIVFNVSTINKKQWSLNNTPSMSPLEGTVEMNITCEMAVTVEHRGFLTMFEDVSGFGAWHRRWCFLNGDILSYWKYPDDEKKQPPINTINLRDCITKEVGPVSREICARLHTFLLEIERNASSYDKESLVTVRKGPKTVIRHLLSADTKEERIEWCNQFNSALSVIHMARN